jgi:hypothetical protein
MLPESLAGSPLGGVSGEIAEGVDGGSVDADFEVEVWAGAEAGVADEADHLAGPDAVGVEVGGRVAGQVGVVELVADAVAHPQSPAAYVLPADAVDRSARDGDNRGAERGEDVVAVMPVARDIASEGAMVSM